MTTPFFPDILKPDKTENVSQSMTLSMQETLSQLKGLLAKYKSNKFNVTVLDDGIFVDPLEEDDNPYYELSKEGEASLKQSIKERDSGLGKPISQLDL